MADLVSKKSTTVVSSQKTNDVVCSVKNSNNGLIDLDITPSNNQLGNLCDDDVDDDDDLILTNNTKNEMSAEEKSLQELIESELALRICSEDDDAEVIEDEPPNYQPEVQIKKIVIEPRQDLIDINAEFIRAEIDHYNIVDDPYTCRNGHSSPDDNNSGVNLMDDVFGSGEVNAPVMKSSGSATESLLDLESDEVQRNLDDVQIMGDEAQLNRSAYNKSSETQHMANEVRHTSSQVEYTTSEVQNMTEVHHLNTEIHTMSSELCTLSREVRTVTEIQTCQVFDDLLSHNASSDEPEFEIDGNHKPEEDQNDLVQLSDVQLSELEPLEDAWPRSTKSEDHYGQFSDDFAIDHKNLEHFNEIQSSADELPETEVDPRDPEVAEVEAQLNELEKLLGKSSGRRIPEETHKVEMFGPSGGESELAEVVYDFLQHEVAHVATINDDSKAELAAPLQSELNEAVYEDVEFPGSIQNELSNEVDYDTLNNDNDEVTAHSKVLGEFGNEDEHEFENCLPDGIHSEVENTNRNTFHTDNSNDLHTLIRSFDRNHAEASNEVEDENDVIPGITNKAQDDFESHIYDDVDIQNEVQNEVHITNTQTKPESVHSLSSQRQVAPLATPDDESSDLSNTCDSESHEEVITTTTLTSSTGTKAIGKTKKKKIEGSSGDVSQSSTPKSKKTKKSKKSELEKENISVNANADEISMMHVSNHRQQQNQKQEDAMIISDEDDLSNVNVKSLTQCYVSETSKVDSEKLSKEIIETGVSIKQLCRSFGDISNTNEVDFGAVANQKENDAQEKAKSMDDLRYCDRTLRKLSKDASVFARVSVTALRASYCSLANLTTSIDKESRLTSPKSNGFEKSSFNKFDALTKKSVLHVRSVDASKVQQQLNAVGQNGDANPNCRSCGKVVFQMEQTKAEGLVWHKNCFRCVQCSKQLSVDNYESNECILYCKAHFKELFQPKPVEETDQPVRPRKPEMIIRENEPKELPPDVVRASDKPDLGLEELSSLNVKSRFQVFEKSDAEKNEIERSPSQVAVKRSPSILSKLAKFQAKGMDIGVADDSLNGIPYEESSESEEEEEEEDEETEIVKSKRTTRERPMSFSKMDDMKNRWEVTSQQGRKESQREARKEEIAGIRSRLFMGKQGKMKEMYQQAVATSEKVMKINPAEEIQNSTHAKSIKERFERGEPIAGSDDETDQSNKPKVEKPDEEVIAAGISRKSRSLFLELDATAAKSGRPVTPVNSKPTEAPRRARDAFMGRQVSEDVVRSTDTTEEVQVETSDISNKFKFFETYKEPEKQRKQFRITPPRDGQVKANSPDREIYRDPDVIRADDPVDEVVHTDTARKMLSIFRQMEEKATKEDVPDGPKPLKCFTPPPEDKYAKPTASDSEEEEEDEGEEEASDEERDPNYVRASDKVEDEFLKQAQAQKAAKAKTLRAKFEHWETNDGKTTSHGVAEMEIAQTATADGEQQHSIESARSLRARFESLGSQPAEVPRAAKVKVNRFVGISTGPNDICESCEKTVYPLEKVETNNKIFHKHCFRCLQCNCVLRMDTFTLNNGKLYCIPHFKQLFIARGNYDEGFGVDPHKNKWSTAANPTSNAPIVTNGGATPVANQV